MGNVIKHASLAEVIAVPTPAPTATWRPVGHGELIGVLRSAVMERGLGVQHEHYTLTKDGARLFGAWVLDVGNGGRWMLGFRQGLDKSLSIGITAGTYITVCSNMQFAGDFVEFRMHTKGLTPEALKQLATGALDETSGRMGKLLAWQDSLQTRVISEAEFKAMTYDLLEQRVVMPSQWGRWRDMVDQERVSNREPAGAYGLHTLHGAGTRLLRGLPIGTIQQRSARLLGVIDTYRDPETGIYSA